MHFQMVEHSYTPLFLSRIFEIQLDLVIKFEMILIFYASQYYSKSRKIRLDIIAVKFFDFVPILNTFTKCLQHLSKIYFGYSALNRFANVSWTHTKCDTILTAMNYCGIINNKLYFINIPKFLEVIQMWILIIEDEIEIAEGISTIELLGN